MTTNLTSSCWLWTASRDPSGYGQGPGRAKKAHRVIYEMFVGPIPKGMVLDHICRQRGCVNPLHLRPVTNRQNLLADGSKSLPAVYAHRTHCSHGHPYSGKNLRLDKYGYRYCRACGRAADAVKREREKIDRYCMQCRKPMRRRERIEMGWSVMTGRIAVCSQKCCRQWNTGGRFQTTP